MLHSVSLTALVLWTLFGWQVSHAADELPVAQPPQPPAAESPNTPAVSAPKPPTTAGQPAGIVPAPKSRFMLALELAVRSLTEFVVGDVYGWSDIEFHGELRLQLHAASGEHRLLHRSGETLRTGTQEVCRDAAINPGDSPAPNNPPGGTALENKAQPREVVILIHGMLRTASALRQAERRFTEAGYRVINLEYASSRIDLATAGRQLRSVVQSIKDVEHIHFVGHSAGGLVVRACLAEHRDPRIGRLVMLGTPNQGADLARRFRDWQLFDWLFGPAGRQLAAQTDHLETQFATPYCEFGIIAGTLRTWEGDNPLVPGADDGIVSVDSTRLPGAKDFMTVNCSHGGLCRAPEPLELCLRFLKHGSFQERQPSTNTPAPTSSTK